MTQRKLRDFFETENGYSNIKRDIKKLATIIQKDKRFNKLSRDSEILVQKELVELLDEDLQDNEASFEESKADLISLKKDIVDLSPSTVLISTLQSLPEAYSTQSQVGEHYPDLTYLREEYPDYCFNAKLKYSPDLEQKDPTPQRITEFLELNYKTPIQSRKS